MRSGHNSGRRPKPLAGYLFGATTKGLGQEARPLLRHTDPPTIIFGDEDPPTLCNPATIAANPRRMGRRYFCPAFCGVREHLMSASGKTRRTREESWHSHRAPPSISIHDRWLEAAGLVLVRQRPGSAKGVMFITLEDETGIANLVVWPQVFERFRRTVIGATMIAARGRIQREGEVVHLVVHKLTDLSAELATVGRRNTAFPVLHGRSDQVTHAVGGPDRCERQPSGLHPRHIDIPDLLRDTIEVKSRDFR
jgi:hypothetical protein